MKFAISRRRFFIAWSNETVLSRIYRDVAIAFSSFDHFERRCFNTSMEP
jgi:hypothetical protein